MSSNLYFIRKSSPLQSLLHPQIVTPEVDTLLLLYYATHDHHPMKRLLFAMYSLVRSSIMQMETVTFDADLNESVFESTIRVLGDSSLNL